MINLVSLGNTIDCVTDLIDWIQRNKQSAEAADFFAKLVKKRRLFKRIKSSLSANPTIAAFGESQMGKSYIISSILSSPGHPLMIKTETGEELNYLDNFNEENNGHESTGVVTRFTTNVVSTYEKYPIKIITLSISDIILMIADGYMRMIDSAPYTQKDLEILRTQLIEKYQDRQPVQNIITEDEIGDIEEYLQSHQLNKSSLYIQSGYFSALSMIIRRIPSSDWVEVFEYLWMKDDACSKILRYIIRDYEKICFAKELYINSLPVLNNGAEQKTPSLMSVGSLSLLNELYQMGESEYKSQVFVPAMGVEVKFEKGLLSLLAAEVVYHVEKSVVEIPLRFDYSGIRKSEGRTAEQNAERLHSAGFDQEVYRSFLVPDEKAHRRSFDLLDFPGARERPSNYTHVNIDTDVSNFLLREKVSYLFTKYSEERRISILLFCHDQTNATPNLVAPILADWVKKYIGENAIEREKTMSDYGISPLFLISTKYNMDLIIDIDNVKGFVPNRRIWENRLGDVLYKEVIGGIASGWFDDWTKTLKTFPNTYLLRDYKYSANINKGNRLFNGYPGNEKEELNIAERQMLKEIFLKDENVNKIFENPELSWDTTSTIGNDGAYYLMKRLGIVSDKADAARTIKFQKEYLQNLKETIDLVEPLYVRTDVAELLGKAVRNAKQFNFMMRMVSEKHHDFFGRMIQFLQLSPSYTYQVFSEIIHSQNLVNVTNVKEYESITAGVEEQGYKFTDDEAENWNILYKVFGLKKGDSMLDGLDMQMLFSSSFKKRCNPSIILANHLIDSWLTRLSKPEKGIYFSEAGFAPNVFTSFLDTFSTSIDKVDLRTVIADSISEYVDKVQNIAPKNERLVADVATSLFNAFVMNLGYSLMDDETMTNIREINEKEKLMLSLDKGGTDTLEVTDVDVQTKLFESFESLESGDGSKLLKLPSYINMKKWIEYVTISYIATFRMPHLNEEENNLLKTYLDAMSAELSSN